MPLLSAYRAGNTRAPITTKNLKCAVELESEPTFEFCMIINVILLSREMLDLYKLELGITFPWLKPCLCLTKSELPLSKLSMVAELEHLQHVVHLGASDRQQPRHTIQKAGA